MGDCCFLIPKLNVCESVIIHCYSTNTNCNFFFAKKQKWLPPFKNHVRHPKKYTTYYFLALHVIWANSISNRFYDTELIKLCTTIIFFSWNQSHEKFSWKWFHEKIILLSVPVNITINILHSLVQFLWQTFRSVPKCIQIIQF